MTTRHDDMDGGVTAARIEKEAASPAVDYEAMWWQAERDREQAERFAALWKEVARRNFQYRVLARTGREFYKTRAERAERSRDKALARAERAECHDCISDAAVITDDMVERAQRVYPLSSKRVREMLTAALTEPPARPDGAEAIEALLREIEGVGFVTDPVLLSRHLAARGVRVTEGEL